jgi:PilZ domain
MQYQKNSIELVSRFSHPAARPLGAQRMDRRIHKRFDLEATARFSWTDAGGVRWQGQGRTRDISETGIFVVTPDCPPSGVPVRLEVRASALTQSGLVMQTRGQVVRVEPSVAPAPAAGFAASTRSLKLRNCKPGVTRLGTEYQVDPAISSKSLTDQSRKPN